jgi:DNA-binding NarL/FixJ family response regulator
MQVIGAAQNDNEAVRIAQRLKPDSVIMDMDMPAMDGLAATKALKHSAPETQVIILTIFDDEVAVVWRMRRARRVLSPKMQKKPYC